MIQCLLLLAVIVSPPPVPDLSFVVDMVPPKTITIKAEQVKVKKKVK